MSCTICLEPVIKDKLKTACDHVFHYQCLSKWCKQSSPAECSRFLPVGTFWKDVLPFHHCPVCRQPVQQFVWREKTHTIYYNYDGSGPYRLQPGALVYYYQRLRQPGSNRAGSIGVLRDIDSRKSTMTIDCLWPDRRQKHVVRQYLVFDILFLALPGSIPTRSQVNQFFVADNLGNGFVTETQVAGMFPEPQDLQTLKPLLQTHFSSSTKSPLAPNNMESPRFFCDVYLANALMPLSMTGKGLIQPPAPDLSLSLEPHFKMLQSMGIGMNQARIIWAYYKLHGLKADEEGDAERVLGLLKKEDDDMGLGP